jgi:YHS domain-containing protein
MMEHALRTILSSLLLFNLLLMFPGCQQDTVVSKTEPNKKNSQDHDLDHEHLPGAHGGTIVPLGADSYHAEALLEQDGTLRLFMLGKDESRIQEVDVQSINAFVKQDDAVESKNIELTAQPQSGDSEGKTSQFVGKVPAELLGKSIRVTIPNLAIAGERFRVAFELRAHEDHGKMGIPAVAGEEETLYLTPGGKYTAADIEANGKTIPSIKFKGIRSNHDDHPVAGDKICPISKTKANDQFAWVIDGKSYTFCCPPCIDEFLRSAKEQPDQLKAPESYIKE